MATTHLIFDLETLGIKERETVILSLGVVAFTFEGNETYDDIIKHGFYRKINATTQLKDKRPVDQGTIAWWKTQSEDAQKLAFLPSPEDIDVKQAFRECAQWIKTSTNYDFKNSWVWSRGIAFDFPKIEFQFDDAGIDSPINLWKARDIRTMIDCLTGSSSGFYKMDNEPSNFVKHHCLHDAAHDAAVMKEIFYKLSNKD